MRLAAVQRWPAKLNAERAISSAIRPTSASPITTTALLPPSSAWIGFNVAAHANASWRPAATDAVTLTRSTSECRASRCATWPSPRTTVTRPSGSPASASASTTSCVVFNAGSAGFHTAAFPSASAGISLPIDIASGLLKGVIAATTPTGCRRACTSLAHSCHRGGMQKSATATCVSFTARSTSRPASPIGFPTSVTMAWIRASPRARSACAKAARYSPRSSGTHILHSPCACAAATAACSI